LKQRTNCHTVSFYEENRFLCFYRVMLCIVQTMQLQDVCSSVYLFVCLSITCRYSAKTVVHILKLLRGGYTTLVFAYITVWQYSDGASNARGYEKIEIIDQYLALLQK